MIENKAGLYIGEGMAEGGAAAQAGLLALGRQLQDEQQQQQLTAREVDVLNGRVGAYSNMGILTADDAKAFLHGNISKKREIASMGDTLLAEHVRNSADFTPESSVLETMKANGYTWAQQSKHGGSWYAAGKPPQSKTDPSEVKLPSGAMVVDMGDGHRELVRPAAEKPLDANGAMMLGQWQQQLGALDSELNEHTTAMSQGDNRYGFMNVHSRPDRVAELQGQRAGLVTKIDALKRGGAQVDGGVVTGPAAAPTAVPVVKGPGIVKVSTKAERDALPVGTQYMGPNGSVYTKK